MKSIINIVLLVIIAFLVYMLINSIKEPIAFEDAKNLRSGAVIERLEDIRTSQELYKSIKGKFASTFDSLTYTLKNEQIPFVKIEGDPDDIGNLDKVTRDTIYFSAIDSINALGINLDSLHIVPFSKGDKFTMQADTLTYQSALTNVLEVGTVWKSFMGPYANRKYTKYDKTYEPNARLKFGDMNKPSLSGNWN
jgi:hypothetical protein